MVLRFEAVDSHQSRLLHMTMQSAAKDGMVPLGINHRLNWLMTLRPITVQSK